MSWRERIEVNPEIAAGRPIVKGTRLTVEFLIDLLAQGWSEQEVLENYPAITREDLLASVRACMTGQTISHCRVFAKLSTRGMA